ncbi:actin cytoskeleton and mitosis protein [Mycoemilia scoparia]|uniref:Actin cytoskeleton and mitosis protein n=1 Tax=Mycoemilia scoparia TaxID=417184 RepID=A0A9W8DV80_9FUNG|nr:actin cytoskeleton and mitosis protein [Mycoemilia scoparia]
MNESNEVLQAREKRFSKETPKEKRWNEYHAKREERERAYGEFQKANGANHKIVGTCTEMASQYDREKRMHQDSVHILEKNPLTNEPDESKMVTEFTRSAAGREYLPEDIRAPDTLVRTVDYLVGTVLSQDPEMKISQNFVHNRTRAIRTEFEQQSVSDHRSIAAYEQIARFHILSLHLLLGRGDVSLHNESEQLHKTLITLMSFYNDARDQNITCPNEGEFRAYLLVVDAGNPATLLQIEKLPRDVFMSPILQKTLKLCRYSSTNNNLKAKHWMANHYAPQSLFSEFFREISKESTPYLLACLFETRFVKIRRCALHAITCSVSTLEENCYPLSKLTADLGFNDEEECEAFCKLYSLSIIDNGLGVRGVEFRKTGKFSTLDGGTKIYFYFKDPVPQPENTRSVKIIDQKGKNLDIVSIIRGRVPSIVPEIAPALARAPSMQALNGQTVGTKDPTSPFSIMSPIAKRMASLVSTPTQFAPSNVPTATKSSTSSVYSPMAESPFSQKSVSATPNLQNIFMSPKAVEQKPIPNLFAPPDREISKQKSLDIPIKMKETIKEPTPPPSKPPTPKPEIKTVTWHKSRSNVSITATSKQVLQSIVDELAKSIIASTFATYSRDTSIIKDVSHMIYESIVGSMTKKVAYHTSWVLLNKSASKNFRIKNLKLSGLKKWTMAINRIKDRKAVSEANFREISGLLSSTHFSYPGLRQQSTLSSQDLNRVGRVKRSKEEISGLRSNLWTKSELGAYSSAVLSELWRNAFPSQSSTFIMKAAVVEAGSVDSLESQWLWWHIDSNFQSNNLLKEFVRDRVSFRFYTNDFNDAWSRYWPTSIIFQIPPMGSNIERTTHLDRWDNMKGMLNQQIFLAKARFSMPPPLLVFAWPQTCDGNLTYVHDDDIKSALNLEQLLDEGYIGSLRIVNLDILDITSSLWSGMRWVIQATFNSWAKCTYSYGDVFHQYSKCIKEQFRGIDSSLLRYQKEGSELIESKDKDLFQISTSIIQTSLMARQQLLELFDISTDSGNQSNTGQWWSDIERANAFMDSGPLSTDEAIADFLNSIQNLDGGEYTRSPTQNQIVPQSDDINNQKEQQQSLIPSPMLGGQGVNFPLSLIIVVEKVLNQKASMELYGPSASLRVYIEPANNLLNELQKNLQKLVEQFVKTSRSISPIGTPKPKRKTPSTLKQHGLSTPVRSYASLFDSSNSPSESPRSASHSVNKRAKLSKQLRGLYSSLSSAEALLNGDKS